MGRKDESREVELSLPTSISSSLHFATPSGARRLILTQSALGVAMSRREGRRCLLVCLLLLIAFLGLDARCEEVEVASFVSSPPRALSSEDEMGEEVDKVLEGIPEEEERYNGQGGASLSVNSGNGARSDKKVAIFGVHFEGNLGDLMETTPLVERLNEWGVEIDCYLSMFRGGMGKIDKKIKHGVGKYCSNFFMEKTRRSEVSQRNYDAIIIAPGPTVDHFKYCFEDPRVPGHNISMVWFGVSVATRDQVTFERQQSCLKLITIRESYSYSMVRGWRAELAKSMKIRKKSLTGNSAFQTSHMTKFVVVIPYFCCLHRQMTL